MAQSQVSRQQECRGLQSVDRVARVLMVAAGWATICVAQESWDQPIEITARVVQYLSQAPVAGKEVTLRAFVGPLGVRDRRIAVFDPPIGYARSDEFGWASLTLPAWANAIDCPFAVVCNGGGDLVRPFQRETHRPHLGVHGTDDVVRFVDPRGLPIAGARVAALIGVHHSWYVRGMTWGPRYENLVVASVGVTATDGSVALPPGAVVGVVERNKDAIPVVLDGEWIAVPDAFDAATADPRLATALGDKEREPPDREAIDRATRGRRDGGGSIEGTVLFSDYEPAEIVAVSVDSSLDILASHRMKTTRPRDPFTQTDGRGHFQLFDLPEGKYRLQVAAPHFAPKLTDEITVRKGRRVLLENKIALERGAVLFVKGTMGCVTFETTPDLGYCSKKFDGPNGAIDGVGPGVLVISSWNGGCCVGPTREIRVPASGDVIVDLTDERR